MFMIVPFWPEMMLLSEFSFENWIFILSPLYSCMTFGAYMLYRRSMMAWIFLLLVMRIEDTLLESSLWNSRLMDEKLLLEVVMILYMFMILKQISLPSEFWHTRYCYHLHKHIYYVFLDSVCMVVWVIIVFLSMSSCMKLLRLWYLINNVIFISLSQFFRTSYYLFLSLNFICMTYILLHLSW